MAALRESPNSVARAAHGWEDAAPEVALGMRHFPRPSCKMAALMGAGATGGATSAAEDTDAVSLFRGGLTVCLRYRRKWPRR